MSPVAPENETAGNAATSAPVYWAEACRHLSKRDRVMKKLIAAHAGPALTTRGDAFATLARSIVGQQISVKAAQSVWERFSALAQTMAPDAVLGLSVEAMRGAGLSARKAEYLSDLAAHFSAGSLHPAQWAEMADEDIVRELVAIRGVGRWTAEMFLMFYLRRPNVLPLDDLGLIKGISGAYYSGEPVTRSEVRDLAGAWAPYCTVATWYIWRSLEPVAVSY